MASSAEPVPILSYAATPRRRWRRYGLAFLLIVIATAGFRWRTLIVNRVTHLYWQHRVERFEYPKQTVVCEAFCTDPSLAPQGWFTITQLIQTHGFQHMDFHYVGSYVFDGYGDATGLLVKAIQRYSPAPLPWYGKTEWDIGPVFAGERRSGRGNRRIVLVLPSFYLNESSVSLQYETLIPANLLRDEIPKGGSSNFSIGAVGGFRAFGGQRDPLDSSRFTIDYETATDKRTIVGVLQNDGSVVFSILNR